MASNINNALTWHPSHPLAVLWLSLALPWLSSDYTGARHLISAYPAAGNPLTIGCRLEAYRLPCSGQKHENIHGGCHECPAGSWYSLWQ
ncbi:hypothetical protein BJ546DRAFT_105428 [Cryomyces antarcticus]